MPALAADNPLPSRPILVAVDFSPASEAVLLSAARRAEAAGAPLVILHVVHERGDQPGFYSRVRRANDVRPISDLAAEMLDAFLTAAIAKHPQRRVLAAAQRQLVSGVPKRRIVEVARSVGALEILVGSREPRRSTVLEHVRGSVGGWIVRHSGIPVTRVSLGQPVGTAGSGERHPFAHA